MLSIRFSLQEGTYEMTDKVCRECGSHFRGYHWTRPPCKMFHREYVFEGRVIGRCGPCINREEERQERMERAERERIRKLHAPDVQRPKRTREAGDEDAPF